MANPNSGDEAPDLFGSILSGLAPVGIGSALLGLISKKKKEYSWKDYSDPRINSVMDRLINGNVGAQNAALAAGSIRNQANEQYEAAQNNPAFNNNASVQNAFYNNAQGNAERGIAGAFAQGAQVDSANMAKGAEIGQTQQQLNISRNQFQNELDKQNNQPGFFEQMLGQATQGFMGSFTGGLSSALQGNLSDAVTGTTPNDKMRMATAQNQGQSRQPINNNQSSPSLGNYNTNAQMGNMSPMGSHGIYDDYWNIGGHQDTQGFPGWQFNGPRN